MMHRHLISASLRHQSARLGMKDTHAWLCLFALLPCMSRAADLTLAQRSTAARTTAESAASCMVTRPFYWEIGNAQSRIVSGQAGEHAPAADTVMPIASASKWIYAAYIAQRRNGVLDEDDIRFLTFRSGYTRFHVCRRNQTVAACMDNLINGRGRVDPSTLDKFDYNGGHMQQHAMLMGLGDDDGAALGAEISHVLAAVMPGWSFSYVQPQPAGGGATSPNEYARFLRALMTNQLRLGGLLGSHAVCASPAHCPGRAVRSPLPQAEFWHYSIGHWVEDDPQVGDGAFSSPGAFGFYPWISQDRQYYGILARDSRKGFFSGEEADKPYLQSVMCGRAIRAAWLSGQARP